MSKHIVMLTLFLFMPVWVLAGGGNESSSWGNDRSAVLGGYTISHKGLGRTTQFVETADIVFRYEHTLFEAGSGKWYQGFHALMVELPFSVVLKPDTAVMTGMNFLANWTFTAGGSWQPYLLGGGGVVYTNADIRGLGSELNGNWQFGAGIRHALGNGMWFTLEYRFHHISNLGTRDPNDPINSSKFMAGIIF